MTAIRREAPEIPITRRDGLPYLVEHWYLGSRTRHYMMVRRFREVIAHARLEPGLDVLDLGCGWAYGTLWAREHGCRTAGVDLGLDQLRWARTSLPRGDALGLVQANARALPFGDARFDRAISVEMMEHVFRPDRAHVVAEIARVLKPGGRFAISTPNPSSPIEAAKRLAVRWPALRRRLPSSCFPEAADDASSYHPYRYHHPLTLAELRVRLREAGLAVEGARRFLWVPKTLPDPLLAAGRGAEADGSVALLLEAMGEGAREAGGRFERVRCYDLAVRPCAACGPEPTTGYCVFHDAMDRVYALLHDAHAVAVGSPIYFDSVSGPLKLVIDRCNCITPLVHVAGGGYDFRPLWRRTRRGVFVTVHSSKHPYEAAERTVRGFLKWVGTRWEETIAWPHDDNDRGSVTRDPSWLARARATGRRLIESPPLEG
jgi:multimeric flavodoxin WrbA